MSEEGAVETPSSIAAGRFVLSKQIGSGCFGEVWLGNDTKREDTVAVKIEVKSEAKHLANEYEILSNLKRPHQQQGFTEVFHFGREGKHICLVMELLGRSLEDWHEACGGKFNVKTTALLGEQILRRLEYLHSKCIIHRDIKPENFMMGVGSRMHIVYLIDFGLSEVYYYEGEHATQIKDSLTGTARYASLNAHDMAQSRRDDLEATGHMLVFFLRGALPWSGLKSLGEQKKDGDEFAHIRAVKKATKLFDLCAGLPPEIEEYLTYCKGLQYKQRPDYARLRNMLRRSLERLGDVEAHELQWLLDGEPFQPGTLTPVQEPWLELRQPDDGQADRNFSICGCCKRREEPSIRQGRPENQPFAVARGGDDDVESIGKGSVETE